MTTQPTGVGDFTGTYAIVPADLLLDNQQSVSIGAGIGLEFGPYVITSPSYGIALTSVVSLSGTLCVYRVTLTWTDSESGLVVDAQTWYATGSTASFGLNGTLTAGRGPSNADTLTVTIANLDPAEPITIDYASWQSSRIVTRHDWRTVVQNGQLLVFSQPLSNLLAGQLAWVFNNAVAANSSPTWLCPLYAGQVQLTWFYPTATNMGLEVYVPLPDQTAANQPQLYNPSAVAAAGTITLLLPRCPVVVKVINNNSSTESVHWSLTIGEYAS